MRRYIISHFREPVDIASSSLGEKQAIYGGGQNLKQGIKNVVKKYNPALVGVATTCLTETIGDDVAHLLYELAKEWDMASPMPQTVRVSTPSYQGSHIEGFNATVRAIVDQLSTDSGEPIPGSVNILPGLVSPEDIRHLKEIAWDFRLDPTILPDYSETLDGPATAVYEPLPEGGTPLAKIERMTRAQATLELGRSLAGTDSAGEVLAKRSGIKTLNLGLPVGLRESDAFFEALGEISGNPVPKKFQLERGRLIDAFVDGHKYLFGQRAVLYGEEDLVIGLASFLAETGILPVLCATGVKSASFSESIASVVDGLVKEPVKAVDGVDFHQIREMAGELRPDLLIGNSKGYSMAREWKAPLIRVGFPIHDRFGGQRLLHLGYRGALRLYDEIANAILKRKQESSRVGYGYL
jgi:nitrogenase molybdenum-iron protein NifN